MKDLGLAEIGSLVSTAVCMVEVEGWQDRYVHWYRALGVCFQPVPSG